MKRPSLQIIQSLSGIMTSFTAMVLLALTGWAISGSRIGYSWGDDSGGIWMACGSLYSDPKWPLYFLPLFGLPALFMLSAIYVFRSCSRQLDGTLGQPDHRVYPKNKDEETNVR
jgi:hypothetical protein